jgi:hypothetical protein
LPTAGVSVSAVLAFFTVAPVVAPAVVELLLPMRMVLNGDLIGMGRCGAGAERKEEDDDGGGVV